MANDPPTNLRMGFGFQQHRAASVPYQAPPTTNQIDFHLKELAAKKEMRTLVQSNPSSHAVVRKVIKEHGGNFTAQDMLFILKCVIAGQSKLGFIVTGTDGKIYKAHKIECIYPIGLSIIYEGRPFMLYRHYIQSIGPIRPTASSPD